MQYRFNNKFTVYLVISLLVTIAVSAHADNNIRQQLPADYSLQLAGGQYNPWALPPKPEKTPGFKRPSQGRNQQYQTKQGDFQYSSPRFVTPEILESIKQQQMETQQVPGNYPRRQYRVPRQVNPPELMPTQPYYGRPPGGMGMGGMGSSNPLYDVPAVSPWGKGPDVLYRGESFPWLPNEAIGGFPPIPVQPFTENNGAYEEEKGFLQNKNKVFNPFTFGPNGNL